MSAVLEPPLQGGEIPRRAWPSFYVIDDSLTVVLSCGDAPVERGRLPPPLAEIVRNRLGSEEGTVDEFVAFDDGRLVRIIEPSSSSGAYLCVMLERLRGGDLVGEATRRYALTPREGDVLRLMLRGHTTEGIARALQIAITTAADHSKRIISKTGCRNRSQVVARVLGGA